MGGLALVHVKPAWSQEIQAAQDNREPVTVEANEIRARPNLDVTAEGDALLQQGPLEVRGDRLSYEVARDLARAQGNVKVMRDGNTFSGPEMQLQVSRFEGYFISPTYFFSRTQAGGNASRLDFIGENLAVAHDATYTSCPRDGSGDPAWLLSADEVKMDFARNEGIAKGAVLRFYGVPILAAPVLSFPLTDARKSGWLPPSTGLDSKSGFQLSVPYYWNIAPNRDATISPTVITRRGVGLNGEFRYLEPSDEGKVHLNVLPDDRQANRTRGAFGFWHDGTMFRDGVYKARVARVTDDEYWKDFSLQIPTLTPRLLASDLQASQPFYGNWATYARTLRWQVIQEATAPLSEAPYDRYPQIGVKGSQALAGGFEVALQTEFNRFTNPDGNITPTRLTGSRLHALGSVSWAHITPGWSLIPKLSVNAASYNTDRPLVTGEYAGRDSFSRVIPTFSLDSAWVLERDAQWFGRNVRQTLEPRLFYVKTPYKNQTGLPNFDSAGKDFNFDSIYTDNAFSGVDRVSDAHQLTAGVTTRVLDPNTGAETVRLGVAQRVLFNDQRITPDGTPFERRASDLLLLGSATLQPRWKLNAGLQYSPDIERTVRSVLGLQYSPGPYRTVSAAYRLKREESEQLELGWQWPIYGPVRDRSRSMSSSQQCSGSWYSVGRVNYSLRDSRITDSILGFEYDAGCWIGRLVAKRLSTNQREATTSLGFEVEFVGLSRLGTNPLQVLKDNVPGYRMLRDDRTNPTAP